MQFEELAAEADLGILVIYDINRPTRLSAYLSIPRPNIRYCIQNKKNTNRIILTFYVRCKIQHFNKKYELSIFFFNLTLNNLSFYAFFLKKKLIVRLDIQPLIWGYWTVPCVPPSNSDFDQTSREGQLKLLKFRPYFWFYSVGCPDNAFSSKMLS